MKTELILHITLQSYMILVYDLVFFMIPLHSKPDLTIYQRRNVSIYCLSLPNLPCCLLMILKPFSLGSWHDVDLCGERHESTLEEEKSSPPGSGMLLFFSVAAAVSWYSLSEFSPSDLSGSSELATKQVPWTPQRAFWRWVSWSAPPSFMMSS